MLLSRPGSSDPVTFFDKITAGRSQFDDQIAAVGKSPTTDLLNGLTSSANSWSRSGYTITSSDDSNRFTLSSRFDTAASGDAIFTTAYSAGITASNFDETAEWNNPPSAAFDDGVTFTFADPINAFGFEIDNWADFGLSSSLYLQFDGGTPIRVGTGVATDADATASGDAKAAGPSVYRADGTNYEVFIGAVDDSGTFSSITFFGVATAGDVSLVGGTIRYALIPVGAISNPTSYTDLTDSTAQRDLGRYFDSVDDSGDRQTVAFALNELDQDGVTAALKRIFPVDRSSSLAAGAQSGGRVVHLAFERAGTVIGDLSHVRAGLGLLRQSIATQQQVGSDSHSDADLTFKLQQMQLPPVELSSAGELSDLALQLSATPYQEFEAGRHGAWIGGMGSHADGDGTGTTAGYEIDSYGLATGYEYALGKTALAGFMTSLSNVDFAIDGSAGNTDIESYTIGAYGRKLLDQVAVAAAVNLGYSHYDGERRISVGATNAVARSDYDGFNYAATLGVSRLYAEGRFEMEPYGKLGLEGAWTEAYEEEGAGAFNTVIDDDHLLLGSVELGVTFAHAPDFDAFSGDLKLKPFVRQQIELEDTDVTVRFADANTSVAVDGRNLDLTEAGVVAEVGVNISPTVSFYLGGQASVDRYENAYGGFARVGFLW
jgi:hypothetical protein